MATYTQQLCRSFKPSLDPMAIWSTEAVSLVSLRCCPVSFVRYVLIVFNCILAMSLTGFVHLAVHLFSSAASPVTSVRRLEESVHKRDRRVHRSISMMHSSISLNVWEIPQPS